MSDRIVLDGMRVMARVGVPEAERARPQLLEISVALQLDLAPAARAEDLALSVDYALVREKVIETAQQRPRPLLETVAEDVAQTLLKSLPIQRVEVEVRKFILEQTRSVAVRVARSKK